MIDFTTILQNPLVINVLSFIGGWLTLAKPAFVTDLWAKILGIAGTVQRAEDLIKLVDAYMKMHGIIPPDSPVPTANTVAAVAQGHITVHDGQLVLQAMPLLKLAPQAPKVVVLPPVKVKAKAPKAKIHPKTTKR